MSPIASDRFARTLGPRFQGVKTVGQGSMGTVYRAYDTLLRAPVAIKVLHAGQARDRFAREVRALAALQHEHIVGYVAHGVTASGDVWLAMEWLEGEDLDARLERGMLSVRDTFALATCSAEGLAWAHERGLLHRDLKPSNLFLVHGDVTRTKIVDFGLARLVWEAGLTATGTFMGTIEYMPPEQASDAKRADARADVYSLGAVLFHCLTGRPPFTGTSIQDILAHLLDDAAPPVRTLRPETPLPFAELVDAMLMKDRHARPLDGNAVLRALAQIPFDSSWDPMPTIRALRTPPSLS